MGFREEMADRNTPRLHLKDFKGQVVWVPRRGVLVTYRNRFSTQPVLSFEGNRVNARHHRLVAVEHSEWVLLFVTHHRLVVWQLLYPSRCDSVLWHRCILLSHLLKPRLHVNQNIRHKHIRRWQNIRHTRPNQT